jgi:hypothetical protein
VARQGRKPLQEIGGNTGLYDERMLFNVNALSLPRRGMRLLNGRLRRRFLKDFACILLDASGATPYLAKAGQWISLYQAPTTGIVKFHLTPHLNRLRKKLQRRCRNARRDFFRF